MNSAVLCISLSNSGCCRRRAHRALYGVLCFGACMHSCFLFRQVCIAVSQRFADLCSFCARHSCSRHLLTSFQCVLMKMLVNATCMCVCLCTLFVEATRGEIMICESESPEPVLEQEVSFTNLGHHAFWVVPAGTRFTHRPSKV